MKQAVSVWLFVVGTLSVGIAHGEPKVWCDSALTAQLTPDNEVDALVSVTGASLQPGAYWTRGYHIRLLDKTWKGNWYGLVKMGAQSLYPDPQIREVQLIELKPLSSQPNMSPSFEDSVTSGSYGPSAAKWFRVRLRAKLPDTIGAPLLLRSSCKVIQESSSSGLFLVSGSSQSLDTLGRSQDVVSVGPSGLSLSKILSTIPPDSFRSLLDTVIVPGIAGQPTITMKARFRNRGRCRCTGSIFGTSIPLTCSYSLRIQDRDFITVYNSAPFLKERPYPSYFEKQPECTVPCWEPNTPATGERNLAFAVPVRVEIDGAEEVGLDTTVTITREVSFVRDVRGGIKNQALKLGTGVLVTFLVGWLGRLWILLRRRLRIKNQPPPDIDMRF